MRRWVRLAWLLVATAVSLGLLLVLLAAAGQAGSAATWRSELDSYLNFVAGQEGVALRVHEATHASRPGLLTRAMGGPTYSRKFRTDYPNGASGGPDVPYPSTEVVCVLLDSGSPGTANQSRVVFVAWHKDLYNAGWVIHSAARAPFSPAFLADLQKLGCAFKSIL